MSLAALRPGLTVGRLRIRGGNERLATRLAADRVLSRAELSPNGLSPAAILVVRRLADPWPGRLDLRASRADPAWQARTRLALADRAAKAARPWSGAVPAGAEAVFFADRSELLACLLGDAVDGLLASRWWWRTLGLTHAHAVLAAVIAVPELLPAVFTRLAEHRAVAAVAGWLPPPSAVALVAAVCAAYGASTAAPAAVSGAEPEVDRHREPGATRPPWARWIPAEAARLAELAVEQEALAGLAILLGNEPAALRRSTVVTRIARWRAGRSASAVPAPAQRDPADRRAGQPARRGVEARGGVPTIQPAERRPSPHAVPAVMEADYAYAATKAAGARRRTTETEVEVEVRAGENAREHTATTKVAEPHSAGPLTAAEIVTELGGLLHLVHLAQRLGLYGDFTTPSRPGIALGVWDFVTLIGGALLGRGELPRDPVWRLLADLQGRPYARPAGLGFRPPRVWRVPPEWLLPFSGDALWRQHTEGGRVVLRHPDGFVVVDGRTDLDRELRRYGVVRVRPGHARWRCAPTTARARWVAHLAAFLRCRMAVALGAEPADAVRLVLRRPASVSVTPTRVDVTSELAALPIEVRMAAVDRDPGFVPAAGRSLYFHFR